ncbi:MAG: DUF3298 and DUF4163 domain-containing protein [Lachnospiraceae bacterium]|nr:DUF3298 and DUF4163 domain-containing protein [Lachnospiraceae bacterium]
MKKKLLLFGLGICLLFTACSGKNAAENTKQQEEKTDDKQETKPEKEEEKEEKEETDFPEEAGVELTKAPEVSFVDYSKNITDEKTGTLLLSVTENCPVVSIPENEAAAEKINMAFDQKHSEAQAYIEEDTELAKNAFEGLSEEERKDWSGYGYGATYKMVYASTRILSIEAQNYQWQGTPHPNTWTSSYCFDASTGKLLSLSDIFTDKAEAGKIVEEHILKKITEDPYKDGLMEDYESFVPDVLTEDVFYLNDKGLVVICNPYILTTYAAGIIEIEVPYDALKDVMNEKYILD